MNGLVPLAYDYPLLGVFWTTLVIFLWVLWFFLLFKIIMDIFRDHEMSGWGKAGWLIFVIILPFLGVFVYLLARGKGMAQRDMKDMTEQRKMMDSYIRETAGTPGQSQVDQLAKLSEIRARGDITDEEFQAAKQRILQQ
ncbi:SHOCT domain-containing protein [Streptomyces sp. NPDC089799]|uniref:SHOCT domain-containing protein n=1 Tax=Streptomyces sp. NPDC089799 TaxID=3155066 RepID=UPI003444E6BC